MTIAIVLVLAAVAVGYWYAKRKPAKLKPATRAAGPLNEAKASRQFAGVELYVGKNACQAAKELAGTQLLAKDAPRLPLPACTQVTCGCRFKKVDDRRQDGRRSSDFGIEAILYSGEERRVESDRRG